MILDACRNELRGSKRGVQAGSDGCGLRDICVGASWTAKERQGRTEMPDLAIYYGCKEGFCSQESEQLRQGLFSYALKSVFERGESCEIRFNDVFRKYVKSISFCYDLSACDLDIASYSTNSYIPLRDILSLSFSIKVEAF